MMVESLKESGLKVKEACGYLGLPATSYYNSLSRPEKNHRRKPPPDEKFFVEKIKAIKTAHPFWGYRRVHAWLKFRKSFEINKKRVYRIMKEHALLVHQTVHRAKRKPQRKKPRATRPRQLWGIDMTKIMVSSVGWVYLVIVLDWYTKKIVGWDLSLRSRTCEWKRALDMALNREFPHGVRGRGLNLVSDNGSQPTSISFMKDMANLGIQQIFTSYAIPKAMRIRSE